MAKASTGVLSGKTVLRSGDLLVPRGRRPLSLGAR